MKQHAPAQRVHVPCTHTTFTSALTLQMWYASQSISKMLLFLCRVMSFESQTGRFFHFLFFSAE